MPDETRVILKYFLGPGGVVVWYPPPLEDIVDSVKRERVYYIRWVNNTDEPSEASVVRTSDGGLRYDGLKPDKVATSPLEEAVHQRVDRLEKENEEMRCALTWISHCELALDAKHAQQTCARLAKQALKD